MRSKFEELLKSPCGRIRAATIFSRITRQHTAGELGDWRRRVEERPDIIPEAIEKLVQYTIARGELTASIVPTIVSMKKARNLKMLFFKPDSEGTYRLLYLLLSGIPHGDMVVNLFNVDREVFEEFCRLLLEKNVIVRRGKSHELDEQELREAMNVRGLPLRAHPSSFTFAFLNYLVYFFRDIQAQPQLGVEEFCEQWQITDETSAIVFHLPARGGKSSMYIFPRLASYVRKWYYDFLAGKGKFPHIGLFIGSLYIPHRNYREASSKFLEKFLYYFLNGYVNGELLSRLVTMKTEAYINGYARNGFVHAKSFFSKIIV